MNCSKIARRKVTASVKLAHEVVEMSNQLQQNEALNAHQVNSATQLRELSDRLAQRAQQFRVDAA